MEDQSTWSLSNLVVLACSNALYWRSAMRWTGVQQCVVLACSNALCWHAAMRCTGMQQCVVLACSNALYWRAEMRCAGVQKCVVLWKIYGKLQQVVLADSCLYSLQLQAYLKDSFKSVADDLERAKRQGYVLGVKLV